MLHVYIHVEYRDTFQINIPNTIPWTCINTNSSKDNGYCDWKRKLIHVLEYPDKQLSDIDAL